MAPSTDNQIHLTASLKLGVSHLICTKINNIYRGYVTYWLPEEKVGLKTLIDVLEVPWIDSGMLFPSVYYIYAKLS